MNVTPELHEWRGQGGATFDPGIKGIVVAMHKVMTDVSSVRKDRKHTHGFKFVGHDDVTEALREAFVTHGIIQVVDVFEQSRDEKNIVRVGVSVRWVAVSDGSAFAGRVYGESNPVTKRDGTVLPDDLQIGKAVSYAVKTIQLKTFMLIGGYPDNEAVEHETPQRAPSQRQATVSAEQVRLLVEEYALVKDQEGLNALRIAVGNIISGVDDVSHRALEKADGEAAKRIAGGA